MTAGRDIASGSARALTDAGRCTSRSTITRRVGNIAIGPLIAIASTPAGYPGIFLACAVLALVGGATIGVVGRRAARRADGLGSAD